MSRPIVVYDVQNVLGDPNKVSIRKDALEKLIDDAYQAGLQDGRGKYYEATSQLNYPPGVRTIDCGAARNAPVSSSDRPDGQPYESQSEYLGKR